MKCKGHGYFYQKNKSYTGRRFLKMSIILFGFILQNKFKKHKPEWRQWTHKSYMMERLNSGIFP